MTKGRIAFATGWVSSGQVPLPRNRTRLGHCPCRWRSASPGRLDGATLFRCVHGDRGPQCATQTYRQAQTPFGLRSSMSSLGDPYLNAEAVSFMKTIEVEEVCAAGCEVFEDVAAELLRSIEETCNAQRLHSARAICHPTSSKPTWPGPQPGLGGPRGSAERARSNLGSEIGESQQPSGAGGRACLVPEAGESERPAEQGASTCLFASSALWEHGVMDAAARAPPG